MRRVGIPLSLSLTAFLLLATDGAAQSAVDSVRVLLDADQEDAALALARSAVEGNPHQADSHCALALVQIRIDEHEASVKSAERCVELDSQVSYYYYVLGDAYMELAGAKGGLGALTPAKKGKAAVEKAVKLDPDNVQARLQLYFYHRQAPRIAGGSKKEAKRQAEEISKRDPAMGVWTRYRLRAEKAKDDERVEFFEEALPLCGPTDRLGYAMETAAGTATTVKNDALAERLVSRLYQANSSDPRAQYYRARLWALQGRSLEDAERLLVAYIAQDERPPNGPSFAGAHWRLGLVFEKQGRTDEAIGEYRKAAELIPNWEDPKKDADRLEKVARG